MLKTLADQPQRCATHPQYTPGTGSCVTCQIFNAWVLQTRTDEGLSIEQLSVLTGIDRIQLRRAESEALYYERYGDWEPDPDE